MGLFESFGKNELQGDTINQKPVVGEKEKRETIVEQFTENSEETDEIRKSDFEAFKKNIDEWYNNYNKIFDISKEEEVLHSEISKGQDNSDRLSKDKSKYGKNFSLNGFAVDENLLSTLAADFNNGYMTESQKIYLSSQVDEICKEANIFSVDRLQKILNVFFHSDVVNTICDNSILLELINKKQNKLKIKVAAIAFVMVFLLFMVSGGSRTLFAMGVALIGMFAVMGLAGFGGFYLAREKFVWNLLISILVAVPAGIAGGLIFAFLMNPFVNLLIDGNILAVIFVSLVFAALAYFIGSKITESSKYIIKLSQNQGLLKEARRVIYIGIDNKEIQGLSINTYIYCLLHYQNIIEYLNDEKRNALQKKYNESIEDIKRQKAQLASKEDEKEVILSKNAEIYNKILKWTKSPKLSWLDNYEIAPELAVLVFKTILPMKHEGKTPLLVESGFENIEAVFPLMKGIIDAFQRMNPLELMDIAVVDLALNAQNWSHQNIPWLFSQTNADGTKTTSGSVKLISNFSELEIYCSELEAEAKKQMTFFQSHRNDKAMEDILKNSDGRSIRELNKYMKNTDNMPFKYHITIILPENIKNCATLVHSLSSGVYCGFIPIILKKRDRDLLDEWKIITENANHYEWKMIAEGADHYEWKMITEGANRYE